jgi:hypothetical protein
MWRARSGERLSDMVNLTRAKDAAIAWARPRGLGGTETVTWHRREIAQVTPLTHEMAVPVLAAPPSRRVGEDVATLTPHRSGRAVFPLPVLHGRVSLTDVVVDTIPDSPVKKVAEVKRHPSFRSCQFSYPLSFRVQVCETQSSLPCCPSTVLSTWHPSFLDRVPVSPVPRCHRSY